MTTCDQPLVQQRVSHRMSVANLCWYGIGIIGIQFPNVIVAGLAMTIFTIGYGMSPTAIGAILMIARGWDAITNPLMGTISDGTRTRWGRRRPYLVLGGALTALTYPLVWLVPSSWGDQAKLTYVLITMLVLYTAYAICSVPYLALGYELSSDYHERTRIQSWRSYFQIVPTLAGGWALWFCQLPMFGSMVQGALWLSVISSGIILLTLVSPGVMLREPYYQVASAAKSESLRTVAKETLTNRPFLLVMGIISTLILGASTTESLGFFVLAYYVYGGDTAAAAKLSGIATTVMVATTFLVIPAINYTAARWGKTQALALCLWLYIAMAAAKWVLVSPQHPWLWIVIMVLSQFGGLGFWVLVNSMKADVCDWDELNSGHRREGAYSAMGSLIQKGAMSLNLLLSGVLLSAIGFDAALQGRQTERTILLMRLAFSGGPIIFLLMCLGLLSLYPLTREKMTEVRAELESRRAAV